MGAAAHLVYGLPDAGPGPAGNIGQARSARRRSAQARQRALAAQRRAMDLAAAAAARMLIAEQTRLRVTRKELLTRCELARMWARVESMPVIEQAKTILMSQGEYDPQEAFDLLRRPSQRSNLPVRMLAVHIVARSAQNPGPGPGHAAAAAQGARATDSRFHEVRREVTSAVLSFPRDARDLARNGQAAGN